MGIRMNEEANTEFEAYVKQAMDEVVKNHQHNHPLYQPTKIEKSLIDKEKKIAAFVLFEQIDTDRLTPESEGWLGDQFRYSVWYIKEGEKPKQLFEDHAYIRPHTKSALTGSRGRDPSIYLKELLTDGVIAEITPENAEIGMHTKTKVKITFDGRIEEPEDFMEQAQNLIKRIGPKLGYDWVRDTEQLEGKNVAAIVYGTENGSTYGYDTVYIVWKDKKGKLNHREVTDSRSTKDYLSVNEIKEDEGSIVIDVKGYAYKISKAELNMD